MQKIFLSEPKVYVCKIKDLADKSLLCFLLSHLSPEERKKVETKKSKKSACASAVGIWLAKTAIKQSFGVPLKKQSFVYEKNGKPHLSGYPDIHFSISHSADYVICAVCSKPVGADIQKMYPFLKRTAKKVCSPSELETLLKSEQKDSDFTLLWTQKEAAVKQTGGGIFSSDIKTCLSGKCLHSKRFEECWISICTKD